MSSSGDHDTLPDLPFDPHQFPPLSALVTAEFAARSASGSGRSSNEDNYLVLRLGRSQETLLSSLPGLEVSQRFDEHAYGMIVADGLGRGGDVASRLAVETLVQLALRFGKWNVRVDQQIAREVIERIERFYHFVDTTLLEMGRESAAPLQSTLTAVVSGGRDLIFAHVGHSRALLFRDREIIQLTRDHTVRTRRMAAPHGPVDITRAASDMDHVLTDAIGAVVAPPRVDVERFTLCDEDIVLLCTNGLTDCVPDERIGAVLASNRSLDDRCAALIEEATAAGAMDDVTVVLARYHVPATS